MTIASFRKEIYWTRMFFIVLFFGVYFIDWSIHNTFNRFLKETDDIRYTQRKCDQYIEADKELNAKEQLFVQAIVGEASGEGILGMQILAAALRNRGTLDGVYGVNAQHISTETEETWKIARQAWELSKIYDLSKGADSWYSKEDLAKKGPPKGKIEVLRYKNMIYYKTIKERKKQ